MDEETEILNKPFYEEEFHYFDIEFQNAENVAEMGEHANKKRYGCDALPEMKYIAKRAHEQGFDTILIRETTELERMFNVNEVLEWTD